MSTRTTLYLLAVALVVAGYRVARIVWFPLTRCWRCKGEGKFRSVTGKHWRLCRRCKGTGTRVRSGRILLDKLRTTRAKARNAR